MLRRLLSLAVVTCGVAAASTGAAAQPITDSDWSLDVHHGAALGSVRIVGMGGAQVAQAQGSAGTLANPAAPAVRSATSRGAWDWDFHLDALTARYASDFDNNGRGDDDRRDRHVTAGIAGNLRSWGLAVVVTSADTDLAAADGELTATAAIAKVALARASADETWVIGGALRIGELSIASPEGPLFAITGSGLEAGAVYRPFRTRLRLGATVALPITGVEVATAEGCTLEDCRGRILPARVAVPWEVAVGAAWRFAPTPWNQRVATRFRDERALTVAADLVITGAVADGMGLEAFGAGEWQRSGRHITASARAGAEWEALPGRLRLRGGTYWEPSRYDGVGGRPHVTVGVEVGFFTFRLFWWKQYRLRLGATGDFAPRFGNAGLSFGFWS